MMSTLTYLLYQLTVSIRKNIGVVVSNSGDTYMHMVLEHT